MVPGRARVHPAGGRAHRLADDPGAAAGGHHLFLNGPPGAGKTMLAGLIAKELDLDMYQVDLAQVVSKWVGETEKQRR